MKPNVLTVLVSSTPIMLNGSGFALHREEETTYDDIQYSRGNGGGSFWDDDE